MQKKCLIISNPTDLHTQVVAKRLEEMDCQPVLFFPETLGSEQQITIANHPSLQAYLIPRSGSPIDLLDENIISVWFRRPRPIDFSSFGLSSEAEEFSRDEWQHLLLGLYDLLETKLWVSAPEALDRCARKISQLRTAQTLGFRVPQTVFTSHRPHMKEAFDGWCRKAIAKPLGRGWVVEGDQVSFVMTNMLDQDHLDNEQFSPNISPITMQEYVNKMYELRVTVVGNVVMPVKIDSQQSEISRIDWRRYDMANTPYTPYELPESIEEKCRKLLRHYGLNFGAIDMIRTPNGEYVFLEINGNGQFLWIEEATNIDISGQMALLLSGRMY